MNLNEKVITIVDWLETRHDAVTNGKASRAWYALFIISVPLLFVLCVCRWVFEAYRNFIFGNPDVTPPQLYFVGIFTFIVIPLLFLIL